MPDVAVGSVLPVVTTSGATPTVRDTMPLAVAGGDSWSVTWTVKEKSPLAVGVPETTPVEAASLSPAGSEPCVTDQAYGLMPPVAASFAE